jgi:hypothetical protein
MFRIRPGISLDGRYDRDVRRKITMAKRPDPEGSNEANYKADVFDQFCERFDAKVREAERYLACEDFFDENGEPTIPEEEIWDIEAERHHCNVCIMREVLYILWPEIESLAIKLGVPFKSEIATIDEEPRND